MVDTVVVGTCSLGLGSTIYCPCLCPSGHRDVSYGCFLPDCASGDREEDFQSPVLPQCPCPAGAVPVLCLENCTFVYHAFSEYWMLVKATFTTG